MATTKTSPSTSADSKKPAKLRNSGKNRPIHFVQDAHPGPKARGESMLRRIDSVFIRFDSLIHRAIPEKLNPMTQSGAIANTTFLIALFSGILLLIWYAPSVHFAYESLEKIRIGSWLGQFVRSLHRYSSDACLFFILIHAFRIIGARRIFGARWLAWVSGVGLLGIVWFLGWTGYWLVWDVRSQHVAEGTARFLDFLPIFGQPMASSFLTNDTVPSLLFFLVFFAHMLMPLAVGIGLWFHLSRVSRPKLLTNRPLTVWIVATLSILAISMPATSAAKADMGVVADGFKMDWWYLWPMILTDRLGGGALWGVFLFGTIAFVSVPWWMKKRSSQAVGKAEVDLESCNGCTLCSKDCPFDAITMIGRTDGRRFPVQAQVDPDRCVGCGICVGACDSDAISLPWLETLDVKTKLENWIKKTTSENRKPMLAFLCSSSAGSHFSVNNVSGDSPSLPGYHVQAVPCIGWVSPRLLEHSLNKGAEGVLISGCGPGELAFREGSEWMEKRLKAERRPIFRKRRADISKIRFVEFDRNQPEKLQEAAADFLQKRSKSEKQKSRAVAGFAGAALAFGSATAVFLGSNLPYSAPDRGSSLVLSFRHPGELIEKVEELSAAEAEKLPVHMRKAVVTERKRASVRVRIFANEELLLDKAFPPRGLRSDGPSVALETIPLSPGTHFLKIAIDDSGADEWPHIWEETVTIEENQRRVLLFENGGEFRLE